MKLNRLIILTLLVSITFPVKVLALTDARRLPIDRATLIEQINSLPIDSPAQADLVLRADHSHLLDTAYDQYTKLWEAKPQEAYTNLWRGMSAELYWTESMQPGMKKLYGLKSSRTDLFPIAKTCLQQAATKDPTSALANMEYGFFLWQFGNQTKQGITLLKKSAQLAPNDPRIHATLGLVYSNNSGNAYSLGLAVQELKHAIRLDPSYAYPPSLMADIYRWTGRQTEAHRERIIYQSLLPK
jgi:tetratricopeptide (TPR) repeat protein